jgi:hypothetical protein
VPTVAAVTPANGTAAVQGGTPVRVELTRADSTDYQKVETTQGDFAAGTLLNTAAVPSGALALDLAGPSSLSGLAAWFKADSLALADNALVTSWLDVSGNGNTASQGTAAKQPVFRTNQLNGQPTLRFDGARYMSAANATSLNISTAMTIFCVVSIDSPSTARQETFLFKGNTASSPAKANYTPGKFNSGSDIKFTYVDAVPAWRDVRATSLATTGYHLYSWGVDKTNHQVQFYRDGGNGQLITDAYNLAYTTNTESLWIGAHQDGSEPFYGYAAEFIVFNRLLSSGERRVIELYILAKYGLTGIPSGAAPYASSGSRVSPAYPLSTVAKFGAGVVQYDTTIPTNTTLVLKISKDGTTWTTVNSGDHIALWSEGDNLSAANIYVRAELATTDTTITPTLNEVRLIFMAQDPALVEIDVGGVACTVANGKLLTWNTRKYASLVLVDPCYQDVFYETLGSWWDDYGPEHVTVLVKYNGTTISTTTFDTDPILVWMPSGLETWWWASAIGGVYDGPMWGTCYYMASKLEDYLVRGDSHWYVQFPPTSTSDAWYLIAHAFRSDTPLAGIVGQPVVHEVPASGVGNCWARCDTPSTGVTQSWMREDHATSGVVAVLMPPHDEALSGIVGLPLAKDTPAAGAVYEVNANNAIDLRVISVEEAAFLDALGLLRQ